MGKHDKGPKELEALEAKEKGVREAFERVGTMSEYERKCVEALERGAVALERLADRWAPEITAVAVVHAAGSVYSECPAGHRMQPTDLECQTCIREKSARKPLPR